MAISTRPTERPLTPAEQNEICRAIKAAEDEYEKLRAKLQAEAAIKARRMWDDADKASSDHRYCARKQVAPHKLKMWRFQDGGNPLLVPMYSEGKLRNSQFVHLDGRKHGLKGGQVSDCHFWIARPDKVEEQVIVICEGWATAQTIFQATGYAVCMTFGANNLVSVAKWVREKYPDHRIIVGADDDWKAFDNPGMSAAHAAARAVGGVVAVPEFGDDRGDTDTDFNDVMVAHGGFEAVKQAFDNAVAPDEDEDDEEDDDAKKKPDKQALALVKMVPPTTPHGGLFRTRDQVGYVDLVINDHRETMRIRSVSFKRWLVHQYYLKTEGSPSGEAVRSAIELVEAKAQFDPEVPVRDVFVRVGEHGGKIYLDLGDDAWRAVEIGSDGWRMVNDPPVRFRRAPGMLALPEPTRGGSIESLRPFVNVGSDDDFVLLVALILAGLRGRGPYPMLKPWGEPGSAKSTLMDFSRALVDPHKVTRRRLPRDDRDLYIGANNGHVLSYDNVSRLPEWLSNAFCNLSTGGGHATRQLFTDTDEQLFDTTKLVMLNGVENFPVKHDFAERCIVLELPVIKDVARRLEEELKAEFERVRPAILGALLQVVSHGLKALPDTHSETGWSRMADFERWITACEGGTDWKPGTFKAAYAANRQKTIYSAIDDDPIATAIRELVTDKRPEWSGTTGELLAQLTALVGEQQAKSKTWPSEPRGLTSCLQNAKASLRRVGIRILRGKRTSKGPLIILRRSFKGGIQPSRPSRPSLSKGINQLPNEDRHEGRMKVEDRNVHAQHRNSDLHSTFKQPSYSKPLTNKENEGREGREGGIRPFKERTPTLYPVNRRGRVEHIRRAARRKRNKPGR